MCVYVLYIFIIVCFRVFVVELKTATQSLLDQPRKLSSIRIVGGKKRKGR